MTNREKKRERKRVSEKLERVCVCVSDRALGERERKIQQRRDEERRKRREKDSVE